LIWSFARFAVVVVVLPQISFREAFGGVFFGEVLNVFFSFLERIV
jgi:hypothetical protein